MSASKQPVPCTIPSHAWCAQDRNCQGVGGDPEQAVSHGQAVIHPNSCAEYGETWLLWLAMEMWQDSCAALGRDRLLGAQSGAPLAQLCSGTGAGGLSAARGACSSPCPPGQPPSEGWQGDAHSQPWGWPCPQQGVPVALSPTLCWRWGLCGWSRVLARRRRQADTESVPGRGRRGPWTRLSLCVGCRGAWGRRGAAPVSLLRLMPAISELLARVRAELEMSGTAAG